MMNERAVKLNQTKYEYANMHACMQPHQWKYNKKELLKSATAVCSSRCDVEC